MDGEAVTSGAGRRVEVDGALRLSAVRPGDVVLVPGLSAVTEGAVNALLARGDVVRLARVLAAARAKGAWVAASCSATFVLAASGLLDDGEATTTWWLAPVFGRLFPSVTLRSDRMVVERGGVYSAGSAFAHADLALAVLAKIAGSTLAHLVTRYLVLDPRPSQSRYMIVEHLRTSDAAIRAVERYIAENLARRLTLAELARVAKTSPRTFARRLHDGLGMTPTRAQDARRPRDTSPRDDAALGRAHRGRRGLRRRRGLPADLPALRGRAPERRASAFEGILRRGSRVSSRSLMTSPRLLRSFGTCLLAASLAFVAGCGARPTPASAKPAAPTESGAPSGKPLAGGVAFVPFDAETFARAKREGKLVLLDGAAEWCHFCHVMDARTYHDPRVMKLLTERFVTARVDIDARPDIQERYADYGWPATILFDAEGHELGAYRGFLPPERMLEVLGAAVGSRDRLEGSRVAAPREGGGALGAAALAREIQAVEAKLDTFYDAREGGFGTFQKAPLGWGNAWLLRRAKTDAKAKERALFTLERQSALVDPVFGGIYQYSEGGTWSRPHYEKLMTFQAPALENYAEAYALTQSPPMLARARLVKRYMSEILREGETFGASQDADLGAHEVGARYLTGHEYYALDARGRSALGMPRVERRAFARENGLAIAAFVTYAELIVDDEALDAARRAAGALLRTHVLEGGGVAHEAVPANDPSSAKLYLADNAAFGFALVRLYERTRDTRYLDAAERIARHMLAELWDEPHGGFYATRTDPNAVGVFRIRRMPLDENAHAIRFLVRLARSLGTTPREPSRLDRARLTTIVARTAYATMTPENVDDRGRMLGEVLLALDDARALLAGE